MKTIGITGGSGFVGSHLTTLLISSGYKVIIFSRDTAKDPAKMVAFAHWDAERGECDVNALKKVDAVVNLAGAGIADKKWSEKRKKEIVNSRVKGTSFLVSQLKQYAPGCKTFVAASAMGYYGPNHEGAIPFSETSPPYTDFLGDTCRQWEDASQKADEFARTVILRFGIVLGKESGAFPRFAQPMSFGIAPVMGSGKQLMSWIEINDLSRLILFALEQEKVSGTYNAVSPNPVTYRELTKTIALVKGGIKIPVTVPAFLLKIVLGEMSGEILKSCTVSAQKTLSTGFIFDHPGIAGAVKAILGK